MRKTLIVGLSASLRNSRTNEGSKLLVRDLKSIADRNGLDEYLTTQGNLQLEHYYEAGRDKGLPFDELYSNLKKFGGKNGLSNSEIALAAALWGSHSLGSEITHLSLADIFKADGTVSNLKELKTILIKSDGLIISSPVYFGDRSSLCQSFIEWIRMEGDLKDRLRGKVYGGVTVGAKRNGGQETTLIYQLHDMMDLGLLGVGNDFETTSQYGGTGHAGDIGTMSKDTYGIGTCVGTGRRVAQVTNMLQGGRSYSLQDKLNGSVWILQDKADIALNTLTPFLEEQKGKMRYDILNIHQKNILPCIACDICPSIIGLDELYRCIRGKMDDMRSLHNEIIDSDIILPVLFSPKDRKKLETTYQQFLERTRYLRRSDYILSDKLIIPIILVEVGTNENLNLRITTSLIRHNTVLHKPIIGYMHNSRLLNYEDIKEGLADAITAGNRITAGRLSAGASGASNKLYKPVGYILSLTHDQLPKTMKKREEAIQGRLNKIKIESKKRLAASANGEN